MSARLVITGGAGFIGSNLLRALPGGVAADTLVAEELASAPLRNLDGLAFADCIDRHALPSLLEQEGAGAVVHLGAITDTRELDEDRLRESNVDYPARVLETCLARGTPLVYASSGAVYGAGSPAGPDRDESPPNPYGASKLAFDGLARAALAARPDASVAGLRFFNVYGPGEEHKGPMASMVTQLDAHCRESGRLRLFAGSGGFGDGEQRRDFVSVGDVVKVILWFLEHGAGGIYDVGTGRAATFNEIARLVVEHHRTGEIEYAPMPSAIADRYQHFTQADSGQLRGAGCEHAFIPVERGVPDYLASLDRSASTLATD